MEQVNDEQDKEILYEKQLLTPGLPRRRFGYSGSRQCETCSVRCPNGVKVRDRMSFAQEVFA
jgi:predicted aldo/keto reductase-like oxidoreductase